MSKGNEKSITNNDYGVLTEPGILKFKRLLPGSMERVWEYLTDSEKRGTWLASGKMELRVGGSVELIFNNDNLSTHDDPIPDKYKEYEGVSTYRGTITKLDPPRVLAYTWAEDTAEESEVIFELSPQGDKVLLELTHRKLGVDRDMIIGAIAGWHTHLGILIDNLNGDVPEGFWKEHMRLEEEYEKRV